MRSHSALRLGLALNFMLAEGYEAASCLKGTGLELEDFSRESKTVTLQQEAAFFRNLQALTKDPCLGLRIGRAYLPQHYGFFGYAALSAPSVRQALVIATEFGNPLANTWFQPSFTVVGDSVHFEFRDCAILEADVRPLYFDMDCAAFSVAAAEVLRQPLPLTQVRLPHDGHGRPDAYAAYFGCPVSFGHPTAVMEFPAALLDMPLPFSDEALSKQLAHQCRLQLSQRRHEERLTEEVRALLIANPGQFPDIEWVAAKLRLSVRTLRRRLSEENSSYQAILDEVRFGIAREYLAETELPLYEIATLLGFSEPGNFTHAFKRWSGVAPNAFRKRAA